MTCSLPSHTLLLTGTDRTSALTLVSQLCLWGVGGWKRTIADSQVPAPSNRPYPQRPRAQEGKWTERGLMCQQAGAQAARVLWPSWPGKSLAGPRERGKHLQGLTLQAASPLLQLPPPQDFITSHLPFTHQCENQGHSRSVHPAPQKPVLSSSPQAPCSLVTRVLVQFP